MYSDYWYWPIKAYIYNTLFNVSFNHTALGCQRLSCYDDAASSSGLVWFGDVKHYFKDGIALPQQTSLTLTLSTSFLLPNIKAL